MNIDVEDDVEREVMEACIKAILILNAVEKGWTVKKKSNSVFQFKKKLDRYFVEDGDHFLNVIEYLAQLNSN